MVQSKKDNNENDFKREIKWSVNTLMKLEKDFPKKKSLLDDGESIFLQVVLFKIPQVEEMVKRRLSLKHPPFPRKPEVCFIARDCLRKDGIKRTPDEMIDYTVERFEDFFNRQKVTDITNILPYYQLKKEYDTYELRRKLVNRFDVFLCSSSLNSKNLFFSCLGKIFIHKNKYPITVELPPITAEYHPKVNRRIKSAIASTVFRIKEGSGNYSIRIGNTLNKKNDIKENLEYVIDKIVNSDLIPGGMKNVRYMSIKTAKSKVVPIYISMGSGRKVPVPYVEPNVAVKESVEGELSTIPGKKVTVLPSGEIFVTPMKEEDDTESVQNDGEEEDENLEDEEEDEEDEEDEDIYPKTEKKYYGEESRGEFGKKKRKRSRKNESDDEDDDDGEEDIESFEQKYLSDWNEDMRSDEEEEEEHEGETPQKGRKRKQNYAGNMTKKAKKNTKPSHKMKKGGSPLPKSKKKEALMINKVKNGTPLAKKMENDVSQPERRTKTDILSKKKSKQIENRTNRNKKPKGIDMNQTKLGKDDTSRKLRKKMETLDSKQAKKKKIVDAKAEKKKMLQVKMRKKMEKAKMKVSGFEKKVKKGNVEKKKNKRTKS